MRKRPKLLDPPILCVVFLSERESDQANFKAAFDPDIKVLSARSTASLWSLLSKHEVHVVLAEHPLGAKSGGKVLAAVREKYPRIRRMLVNGSKDLRRLITAMNDGGAIYCVQKPWDLAQLTAAILRAVDDHQVEAEQQAWMERLSQSNRQLSDALDHFRRAC